MGRLKSDRGTTEGQVQGRAAPASLPSDEASPGGLERIIGRLQKGQDLAAKLTGCIAQGRAEDVSPVFVASPDGKLLYANAAFRQIHGALGEAQESAPPPRPQGDEDEDGIPPQRRHLEATLDGATRRFELDRHILRTASGEPLAIFGRLAAVGELEAMRERLALSEERFRDIASLVSDWMWETDRGFRLTYVSPRVTEALGYRPSELLGRHLQDLAVIPADERSLAQLAADPAPFRDRDITFRHRDGASRSFRLSSLPVYDQDSGELSGFRGTAQDVTELLAHEAALKAAAEAAQAANRTKSEFLANTSHELRTPLNAIIGFTEIMYQEQFGPIGNERYKTYLSDVLESGYHLLTLINDILDVAKIEAGKLELEESIVDPVELCRQTLRLVFDRTVRHGIQLKDSLPAGLPIQRSVLHRVRHSRSGC